MIFCRFQMSYIPPPPTLLFGTMSTNVTKQKQGKYPGRYKGTLIKGRYFNIRTAEVPRIFKNYQNP
jgi:hypothetical protein